MTLDMRRCGALLLGVLLLWPAVPVRAVDVELLPVGSPAPALESVDVDGQPFNLAEALKVKPVLLVFWSLFCATCRDELPILEQEMPKYQEQVQFITVNLDEAPRAKTVKGFAKQQRFSFKMLLNKTEEREFLIDKAYNIKATPAIYLVNSDGTIAFGHSGALNPEELAEVMEKIK